MTKVIISDNRIKCDNRYCGYSDDVSKFKPSTKKKAKKGALACPRCESTSQTKIKRHRQCERVDHINQLILLIANHGRKFFTYNGFTSFMELDHQGKIWFTDYYTQKRIYTNKQGKWPGFTSGGTLKALVEQFAYYIKTGKQISVASLSPSLLDGNRRYCGEDLWGYGLDDVKAMRLEAVKLPCVVGYGEDRLGIMTGTDNEQP